MKPSIQFFYEANLASMDHEEKLKQTLYSILEDYQESFSWINVILLPTEDHTKMNADFLQHHYETDVITFPMDDPEGKAGEIYINEKVAQDNATYYDQSLQQELNRLVIHGVLHLVGLDDHTEEEQKRMTLEEDKYLERIDRFM